MLSAVNGLRFVAAAHVMLEHSLRARLLPAPLRAAIGAGYTSATLLLVLSGFILVWVYSGPDGSMTVSRREFWTARFSRIYPLMIVSQLVVLPLWLRSHDWGETWVPLAAGLTGQQAWLPNLAHVLNTPAWTVSLLVLAYGAFPWLLERLRRIPARALPWAMAAVWAVSVAPCVAWPHASGAASRFLFSFPLMRLPEFLFGMLLAKWFLSRPALSARASTRATAGALGMWAAVLAVIGLVPRPVMHNGLLAPVFALLLVGLASGGGALGRVLSRPWLQRLGHAGIAIFLLHLPVIAWIEAMGWYPGATTAASAAVYAAYLAGMLVLAVAATERFVTPVSAWMRRRFAAPRPVAVVLAPPALAIPVAAPTY
ncbi:acyltransferase [Longimicrobium sp.]|uniref:acyltransferase family protein n=1 Tax=Longimicrobium sp. TaxID=2029185 RepID=UPI002D7EA855|nr:acyltransferase [Longimicrobium sp.]